MDWRNTTLMPGYYLWCQPGNQTRNQGPSSSSWHLMHVCICIYLSGSMFPVWVHGYTRRWWTLMLQVQFAIKIASPHAHGMEICPVPSYRNSTMVFINYKFLAETHLAFWNICISYFIKTSSWKVWKLSLYQHTGCLQNMSRASYCLDHTLTNNFEDRIDECYTQLCGSCVMSNGGTI